MNLQSYKVPRTTLIVAILMLFGIGVWGINGCTTTLSPVDSTIESADDSTESADDSASDTEAATAEDNNAFDEDDSNTEASDDATSDNAERVTFEVTGEVNGIPVGYTDDGYVFRGSPDAPVTIYEYSDYQCPFCRRHFVQTEPALNETYVETGLAKIVFMDFPLEQLHPNAPSAHRAALCVANQSAEAFWEMHNVLFETQEAWGREPDPNLSYAELAQQIDGVDLISFETCMANNETLPEMEIAYNIARGLGFSGTPSFQFVNEETGDSFNLVGAQPFDKFASWIDAMAAGEVPADAQANSGDGGGDGEIPFWATTEGLAPDPDNPGVTVAGDNFRGDPDAEVVVIEYSDFQCPYCRRHTTDTQPILDETFVDSGQVRWVFKHFPLNIHPQAPDAGVAAECASEQGQFWEMHEKLFEDSTAWSNNTPNPTFVGYAEELALDVAAFEACLEDEAMRARVDSDFEDGRPFVRGTPTFIVMSGEQGRIIPGALPADNFVQALQEILDTLP